MGLILSSSQGSMNSATGRRLRKEHGLLSSKDVVIGGALLTEYTRFKIDKKGSHQLKSLDYSFYKKKTVLIYWHIL
jgi:hypothetical protein